MSETTDCWSIPSYFYCSPEMRGVCGQGISFIKVLQMVPPTYHKNMFTLLFKEILCVAVQS